MFINKPLNAILGSTALILAHGALGAPLLVDFDNGSSAGAETETGWVSFTDTADTNNKALNYAGYTELSDGNVTITTTGVEFTRGYANSGGYSAPPAFWPDDVDAMYNDLILRNDGSSTLNVAIGGLKAGTYQITTHHLVSGNSTSIKSTFNLDVTDADSAAFSQNAGTGLSMGKATNDAGSPQVFSPTTAVFNVTSNGTDAVTLRISANVLGAGGTSDWIGINGLEIAAVPEPGSLALLGLGGLLIARRRRD